ncbi:MAG: hypothetical protein ABSD73_00530 [Candidatus Bathyarchaeia archaeon]|jgi:hypothetical protein
MKLPEPDKGFCKLIGWFFFLGIDLQRITLYCNSHKPFSHVSDSDYNELDGCDSDSPVHVFGNFSGYRALPFFINKPKLRIEDCHVGTNDCSFYLHNAGKRTAIGVRVKFKVKQKLPMRPKPPKLLREYGTLDLNFPEKLAPFDLDPDQTISVRLCTITKDKHALFQLVQDEQVFGMPTLSLEKGRKHELLFRFVGRNFSDRKVWHLLLDLRHERPAFTSVTRNVFSQYLSDHLRDTS